MRRTRAVRAAATIGALVLLAGTPRETAAQLISPGKLSAPHAELEGMSNCTRCHELGKRGTPDARCLDCHQLLGTRISARRGLHAGNGDKPCTSCHKEHFGADFALTRFDTTGFDHGKIGYNLKLKHQRVVCRDCHQAALLADTAVRRYAMEHGTGATTFLGLGRQCLDCHRTDDVHGTQFAGRQCNDCHTEEGWKTAPAFDHARTRYALTGRHAAVGCSECHRPDGAGGQRSVQYRGLGYARCTDCHRDVHRGAMRGTCESCHTTGGWNRLADVRGFEATFDHSRTRFRLAGAHAKAACASCHRQGSSTPTIRLAFAAAAGRSAGGSYPAPRAESCMSCHVDYHRGEFSKSPGGSGCGQCHGEASWLPTTYDFARHNRETWRLEGAHLAVPCADCHTVAARAPAAAAVLRFRLDARACTACHAADDPHQGQFARRACEDCHTVAAFTVNAFDHSRTRYPLDGAHQKVACAECHPTASTSSGLQYVRYRPLETTCRACHGTTFEGRR